MQTLKKLPEVLLIEDNAGDVDLVREALAEGAQEVQLSVVEDGVLALETLRSRKDLPDLIILDLNLPKKNGLEVLKEIKADDSLKDVPIAVFTTSQSHKDILKTYGLGGTVFITKPLGFYEFMKSVNSIIANLIK